MLFSFIISFKRTNRITYFIDDWEQRKLKEIVTFYNQDRVPIDSGNRTKGEYPYYGATGIIDYVENYIFDGEYVLLAEDGANITMRNSPIAYITKGKFWLNNHAHIMKSNSENNLFLLQILEKTNYEKFNTGSAQPKLNSNVVRNIDLKIPSSEEQTKIGKFFKQLDETITLQERKLSLLKLMKKGFLQQLFPKNEQVLPDIRFTNFQQIWEQRKFEDIIEIKSGKDYKHLNQGNIPVYGTGGYMLSVDKALSYDEDAIGIGRKGTINNPYLLHAPFWTVDTLFYAIPIKNNNLIFIKSLFQLINWNKFDESTGVPSLSKAVINKVNIKVPENKEQRKIGDFFSQLEENISFQEKKMEKLKQVKIAFLQKLFI